MEMEYVSFILVRMFCQNINQSIYYSQQQYLRAGNSDRTIELEAELAELYRKKEQNDQQLIETNNRLSVVVRELSAVSIV